MEGAPARRSDAVHGGLPWRRAEGRRGLKITFKLYATLSDYLPVEARAASGFEVEVEAGATPLHLVERYALPVKLCHLVLINGLYIEPGQRDKRQLLEGDVVAIWPPIAGG